MNRLVIMIGGAGFLGKNIIQYARGEVDWNFMVIDTVEAIDKFETIINEDASMWPRESLNFMDIDLAAIPLVYRWENYIPDDFLNRYDEIDIFHFASPVGVDNHQESTFYEAMKINQNVFEFAKFFVPNHSKARLRFWYSSTSEVYGLYDMDSGYGDTHNIALHTFYNKSLKSGGFRSDYIYQKVLGENLFKQLSNKYEINILRLFNIVGKFQDPKKGVFAKFVNNIIDNVPTKVSLSIRNYTKVYQLYEFISNEIDHSISRGDYSIYNIVSKDFKNSLTGEELYIYIMAYLKKKYPSKNIVSNYEISDLPDDITIRGSKKTLSYNDFCMEFGPVIDSIVKNKKEGEVEEETNGDDMVGTK